MKFRYRLAAFNRGTIRLVGYRGATTSDAVEQPFKQLRKRLFRSDQPDVPYGRLRLSKHKSIAKRRANVTTNLFCWKS